MVKCGKSVQHVLSHTSRICTCCLSGCSVHSKSVQLPQLPCVEHLETRFTSRIMCGMSSSLVREPLVHCHVSCCALSLLFSCCPVLRFRNSGLTFSNSPRTWRASSGATSSTHRPVGVAAGGVVYAARVQQRPTGCLIAGVRRRSNALRCADPTGANEWPLKALKSPLAADSTPRTTTAD